MAFGRPQQAYPDIGPSQFPESDIPEMQGVPPLPVGAGPSMASGISGVLRQLPSAGASPQSPDDQQSPPHPTEQGESAPTPPSSSTAAQAGYNLAPPTPRGAPGVTAPSSRDSRRQVISDLLAKFTYSLASAYSAPPNRRLGAALMGPFAYEDRQQKLELEKSQELQRTAAVEKLIADINNNQAKLPATIQEMIDRGYRERGLGDNARARNPGLEADSASRPDLNQSVIDKNRAEAARARMIVQPNGVFQINGQGQMEQVPGADTVTRILMTPELVKQLGLPAELEGTKLRPQEVNSLRPQMHEKLFKAADGVILYNEDTGERKKVGELPPVDSPGTFTPLLDPYGQILAFFNPQNGRTVPVPIAGARRTGEAQATLTRTDTFDQLHDGTELLRELSSKHQNVIGPVSGRVTGFMRNVIDLDPEINAMYRLSDNMADILLRARSGAQINEQEYNRLRLLVPNPRGTKSKFFTDLEEFSQEVEKSRKYLPPLSPGNPNNKDAAPETPGGKAEEGKNAPKTTPKGARDQIFEKFGGPKQQGQLGQATDQPASTPAQTVAQRHNNPLNIKQGAATQYWIDNKMATVGEKATDGGNFLKFTSPLTGLTAAADLLDKRYKNDTVDEALKKWSNGGYDGQLVKSLGVDPNSKISDLSATELLDLVKAMAKREGYGN